MEVEVFEREWHGIPFEQIGSPAASDGAAGPQFYAAFYDRFRAEGARLEPRWREAKTNLAEWIESVALRRCAAAAAAPVAVLSLGAGLGTMEEIWLAHGYQVSLQECQSSSLAEFQAAHPDVPIYIGDARAVDAPSQSFDVVVLSALDYVYDRSGYARLLGETTRLLRPGGTAVMVTVSNLSTAGLIKGIVKRALLSARGDVRAGRAVRWGWKRTISEHLRRGAGQGLRVVPCTPLTTLSACGRHTGRPPSRMLQ